MEKEQAEKDQMRMKQRHRQVDERNKYRQGYNDRKYFESGRCFSPWVVV